MGTEEQRHPTLGSSEPTLYRGPPLGYASSLNTPTVSYLPQQRVTLARGARASGVPLSLTAPARLTAWLTRARFVDRQLAALHFDILQRCNSGLGLTGIGHFHKPEAAWPARLSVRDEIDTPYSTIGFEEFPDVLWLG